MNTRHMVLALTALLLVAACDVWVSTETRLERAVAQIVTGDYERAGIELRNVLQAEPNNVTARTKLVETLLLQSNISAADLEAQILRKQITADKNISAARDDVLARVLLAKGDYQGLLSAIQSGELALADTLQLREAQAAVGLGQTAAALDKLRAFLAKSPDSDEGRILYAQLLASSGDSERAAREIDAVLVRSPTYANAWFAKGMWQTMQGGSSEAAQSLAKAETHAAGQLTRAEETILVSLLADAELAQGKIELATKWQQRLATLAPEAPITQLTMARIALAKEDYATAIGILQKLQGKLPNSSAAQVMLGKALAAQGNLRQAEAELDKVVAKENADVEGRKTLVAVNLQLGQNVRALELLAPMAMTRDNQVSAMANKAQVAVAGSPADIANLLNAQKREPANEGLRLLTAGTLLYARQPAQAYALLRDEKGAQMNLDRVPLLLNAVGADKGLAAARAEADRIGAVHANEPRYYVTLGMFFAGNKDYPTARIWFDRALTEVRAKQSVDTSTDAKVSANSAGAGATADISADDKFASAQRVGELGLIKLLGVVDAQLGDKPAALAGIQAYRQAHPDDLAAVLTEADILLELRDFPAAVTAYETVFTKAPTQQAAIALYRARRYARQLSSVASPAQSPAQSQGQSPGLSLEQWLKAHDNDVAVRMLLAEWYQSSGDANRAVTEYERVVALQPLNAGALNNLAVLYQDKGDKRAEPTALQAYKRADKSPEVADTYGWILLQNGKVDEAAKILAAAAAGAPKHPDIQFHYAMAVAKTGKVDDARKQLTELLAQYQKFPTRAEAEKALSELK